MSQRDRFDHPFGLIGGHLGGLDDEARGAGEVEWRQSREELLALGLRPVERDEGVIRAADPQLGADLGDALAALGYQEVAKFAYEESIKVDGHNTAVNRSLALHWSWK